MNASLPAVRLEALRFFTFDELEGMRTVSRRWNELILENEDTLARRKLELLYVTTARPVDTLAFDHSSLPPSPPPSWIEYLLSLFTFQWQEQPSPPNVWHKMEQFSGCCQYLKDYAPLLDGTCIFITQPDDCIVSFYLTAFPTNYSNASFGRMVRYSCRNLLTSSSAFNLLHLLIHLDRSYIDKIQLNQDINPEVINALPTTNGSNSAPIELFVKSFHLGQPTRGGNSPQERGWNAVRAQDLFAHLTLGNGETQQLTERIFQQRDKGTRCHSMCLFLHFTGRAGDTFFDDLIEFLEETKMPFGSPPFVTFHFGRSDVDLAKCPRHHRFSGGNFYERTISNRHSGRTFTLCLYNLHRPQGKDTVSYATIKLI